MHDDDVICLASARNLQVAHMWWAALEEEGVRCQVVGDYLTAGIDVGVAPNHHPELWVHRGEFDRARAILEDRREVTARPDEETN
jgi:Putative prokaryotic signal transducing protein